MNLGGNRFDRSELAGAFGDLGTLVPFVVGYITIARLDPQGVLLGFGLLALATGLYFRTPMPVQPMKAIATVAVTQPQMATPGAIFASAVITGIFWFGMGISGAVSWLAALTSRPVVRGIVLGLGLSFILEGVGLMQRGALVAVPAMVLTFLLLSQPRVPAMLVLLAYSNCVAVAAPLYPRQRKSRAPKCSRSVTGARPSHSRCSRRWRAESDTSQASSATSPFIR